VREPVRVYIGLGANLGDPERTLREALRRLGELPGLTLSRCSSFYRSAPVDAQGPDFVNAVVEASTRLSAPDLLRQLQQLEHAFGRERPYRNAPRTLDLDLLLYGSGRIASDSLTVPHPRMAERAFVLVPLAEIAPDRVSCDELAAVAGQGIEALPA
jgi:2-amino-4-hydroxy-6-hydroxymethyldihydropteridine diphosphokinase